TLATTKTRAIVSGAHRSTPPHRDCRDFGGHSIARHVSTNQHAARAGRERNSGAPCSPRVRCRTHASAGVGVHRVLGAPARTTSAPRGNVHRYGTLRRTTPRGAPFLARLARRTPPSSPTGARAR